MGNKISLPGDCRGKKKSSRRKAKGPTRWQDLSGDTSSFRRKHRTRSMEISLELMEIEHQIENIISIDKSKRTDEDLKELQSLINYKELKTKELNDPNVMSDV